MSMRIVPQSGALVGANSNYTKYIKQLDGCYADSGAFRQLMSRRGDEVAYRVEHFVPAQVDGAMIFGTSTLEPGDVSGEFFMTRGHLHQKSDRPEIYQCLSGEGVMLMETLDGRVVSLELSANVLVYVPPYWIHRSVNVGAERLVTLFCYPADSGQDYSIIERAGGMASLVVKDDKGGWKTTPNPHYRPRAGAQS
jgi:glucose-6-phosphate isomerase